jgi:hypothetical protein
MHTIKVKQARHLGGGLHNHSRSWLFLVSVHVKLRWNRSRIIHFVTNFLTHIKHKDLGLHIRRIVTTKDLTLSSVYGGGEYALL